jgi:tetratricopeptide (TPR) repeat protein
VRLRSRGCTGPPEDWRSWVLWFDDHEKDGEAIRKAAALAPDNPDVLVRLARYEQGQGKPREALEHAERARSLSPASYVLNAVAAIYDANDRCDDAARTQQSAVDILPDKTAPEIPAAYRARLADIVAHCGKRDVIGTAMHTIEAEPVLKLCRQPVHRDSTSGVSAQLTIREDGSVTAVAIRGAANNVVNGELHAFVESCSFEPVVVEGRRRQVQLNLALESLLQ